MNYEYKQFRRRKLPHVHPPGASLFVTFRLAGSIPNSVVQQWRAEKAFLEQQMTIVEKEVSEKKTAELLNHQARLIAFHRRWFRKFEETLDKAEYGPTWLRNHRIAQLVADSLRYRDDKVYELNSYCIMSNHVHTVFRPFLDARSLQFAPEAGRPKFTSTDPPLDVIMHSLKSFTASEANKILGRSGAFWETESYDHVIRNEAEFFRIRNYVLNNPVKAGLISDWREWPWTWKRKTNSH
jgi:putative transposase